MTIPHPNIILSVLVVLIIIPIDFFPSHFFSRELEHKDLHFQVRFCCCLENEGIKDHDAVYNLSFQIRQVLSPVPAMADPMHLTRTNGGFVCLHSWLPVLSMRMSHDKGLPQILN